MAGTKDAGKASKKKKKVAGATGKVAGVKETETRQDPDEQVFLARAQELREEGNKLFQAHEFGKAMDVYGAALKLAPAGHADRAIYHSNRAACLLQMRPVPYIEVVAECSHALQVHAGHPKALLRRAKALEALGKLELAETDLRTLLQAEPGNGDARDLQRKISARRSPAAAPAPAAAAAGARRPPPPAAAAANGAADRGPSLPPRTTPAASAASKARGDQAEPRAAAANGPVARSSGAADRKPRGDDEAAAVAAASAAADERAARAKAAGEEAAALQRAREAALKKALAKKEAREKEAGARKQKKQAEKARRQAEKESAREERARERRECGERAAAARAEARREAEERARARAAVPLKLVYNGSDIRVTQLLRGGSLKQLREVVQARYPASRAVQIKYTDADGDLITITSIEDLRAAEDLAEAPLASAEEPAPPSGAAAKPKPMRLHVVEVEPDQEPPFPEEDEDAPESLGAAEEDAEAEEAAEEPEEEPEEEEEEEEEAPFDVEAEVEAILRQGQQQEEEGGGVEEYVLDEWAVQFVNMLRERTNLNLELSADLQDVGLDQLVAAMDAAMESEEAQKLFEQAQSKCRDMAAMISMQSGNIYYAMAKRLSFAASAREKKELEAKQAAAEAGPAAEAEGEGGAEAQAEAAAAKEAEKLANLRSIEAYLKQAVGEFEQAGAFPPDGTSDTLRDLGYVAQARQLAGECSSHLAKIEEERAGLEGGQSKESLEVSVAFMKVCTQHFQGAMKIADLLVEQQQEHAKHCQHGHHHHQQQQEDGAEVEGEEAAEDAHARLLENVLKFKRELTMFNGQALFDMSNYEYKLGSAGWEDLLANSMEILKGCDIPSADIEGLLAKHASKLEANAEASAKEDNQNGRDSAGAVAADAELVAQDGSAGGRSEGPQEMKEKAKVGTDKASGEPQVDASSEADKQTAAKAREVKSAASSSEQAETKGSKKKQGKKANEGKNGKGNGHVVETVGNGAVGGEAKEEKPVHVKEVVKKFEQIEKVVESGSPTQKVGKGGKAAAGAARGKESK